MSRSATMALEQVFDEGIIHETVQDQECRELVRAKEFATRHPATPSTESAPLNEKKACMKGLKFQIPNNID